LVTPRSVLLALVVLAAALVVLYVRAYPTISPADESQHIDYMLKVSHGHLVARGDLLGQQALREETCRRLDSPFDVKVPRCGRPRHLNPPVFQEGGYNTAYIHPPVYYAIDGLLARGALAVTPGHHDVVTFARLLGALWLAAAVVLIWFVLGEFETPIAIRAVLIVLLLTAPTVLHFSSIVNPDGSALATGAAVLLATLRYERRAGSWVPLAVLSAFAIATKATNGFGVGVCLIDIGVRWLQHRSARQGLGDEPQAKLRDRKRYLVVAGALIGGLAVTGLVWAGISSAIAHVPSNQIPMIRRFSTHSFPIKGLQFDWRDALSPLRAAYVPRFLKSARIVRIAEIVDVLVIAGTLVGIAFSEHGSRLRAVAIAALVAMLLVGPVVVTFNYLAQGIWFRPGTVPRYGLSILPAALVAATVSLRQRVVLFGASVLAGLTLISTILQMASR